MAENLHFAIKLDNEALKKDAKESQNIIKGVSDEAIVEGEKMEKSFNRVGGAVAALFTVQQASKFIRSMVQIRGEFQQLEIAFTTMLRSGEKADKLMADLTRFAGETPFGLQSSANAARQLIAYGSVAENVIEELTMLGDVAAGTGTQIGDLVYLYGTLRTQGQAYTMDIRQFAGRGIPIYDELAKVLGVAKNQVMDLVSAGKVGFPEVEKAFKNMTASGSMYGGLMEKQSKSVTGRIEELTDAIDVMFNEIGRSNEGITYKVISSASTLVENYEKVGKIIAGLIGTYGAYRAAVIVATIAERGWTVASMAQYKWLLLVEKAQKLLNATMFKNPYVAITAAVVALVSSLIIFKDRTSDAEKAQERLNETLEKARERKEALRLKGNELITTLKSETATVYQQIKAYRELVSLLPELKGKSLEEVKAMDSGDLNRMISEREDQVETQTLQDQYNERIKNIEGYRKKIKELQGSGDDASISYYRGELKKAIEDTKALKGQLDEIADIQKEAFYQENPEAKRKDLQSQRVALLQKEAELQEKIKSAGDNDLASANDRIQLEALRNLINENQVALDAFNVSVETITKNKNYWQKILDDATGERDMLGSEDVGSEKWNELTAKIKEATAELSVYTSKTKEIKEEESTISDLFIFDVQREEGLANIQKQVKDFFDARRKANLEGVAQERKEEEEARIEYLIQWGNFEEKRLALIDKYAADVANARTRAEKDGLLKSLEQALKDITSDELKSGGMFSKMFEDFEKLSTKSLNDILDLDQYIDQLDLSIEETKIFKDAIIKARDEIEQRNPFKLLTNSFEEYIEALKSGDSDALKSATKGLEDGLSNVMSFAEDLGDSIGSIFSSFGNDKVGEDINNILAIAGGAGQAAVGIGKLASGDIIGGIKDLASGVAEVVGGIVRMNDAIKEREIQRLQSQLEVLEESYNNLSKAIDKAYSGTAANLIRENEKLLQQQKAIIQKQLEAEKSKKKTDKDAVKRYEQAIKDIDEELAKVEDSIVDVIFGDGVQSAISKFSQAYADAFIAGEDAAEASAKVIENLIKGALVEAMKGDLANLVDDWMKLYSNYISDGIIDSYEQSRLDSLEDEMNRIALKHKKGFDRFVEKEEEEVEEEVPEERRGAKKGFATASQDSINELNGRFTALQQTASYIQIDTGQISASTKKLTEITGLALNYLSNIDKHTAHLESIKAGISNMKSGIDDINLKGVRIR